MSVSGGTSQDAVVLVTGSSRGIGAETALQCAAREDVGTVVVHHRDERKDWMARGVAASVERFGKRCEIVRADITDPEQTRWMVETVAERCGRLDRVVLNASGGLERETAGTDYSLRVNRDAQINLVDRMLPLMEPGGRFAYVTSHWAHFDRRDLGSYTAVASSKRAGEDLLRLRFTGSAPEGAELVVVSGDMVADSMIVLLLERMNPGWIAARRSQVGELPDTAEFAEAVVGALFAPQDETVRTVYVGSTQL